MQVAKPLPLPDEIVYGLVGRIGSWNCVSDRRRLMAGLRASTHATPHTPGLQVIADWLEIPLTTLVSQNTLLPATRAVSAYAGTPKEDAAIRAMASMHSIQDAQQPARTCPRCDADTVTKGLVYWRRIHHLPGVDWCPEHREPLFVGGPSSFSASPAMELNAGRLRATDAGPGEASHPTLLRYVDLMQRWLRLDAAYASQAMNHVVQQGCMRFGLRVGQHGKRRLISDLAREQLPQSWLARHWPGLLSKTPGVYFPKLDGVGKDRHVAYPSPTCALALALLFESADEAQALLATANDSFLARRRSSATDPKAALEAAWRCFEGGSSLQDACGTHGVHTEALETALRETLRRNRELTLKVELAAA
jgi:hypothetical protein